MGASASHSQSKELIDVAANVQRALKPVTPPPAFRERLRDNLQMAAEQQRAQHAFGYARPRRGGAWAWVLGAALIGAFIGFVVIHLRMRPAR